MNRRLLVTALTAALILPGASFAQGVEERVVRQLRAEGYREIRATRTLLGRTRIIAERPGERREVIVNTKHQTILRDHTRRIGTQGSESERLSRGSGRSEARDEDRDGDDRDDEEDEDDGEDDEDDAGDEDDDE